MRRRVLIEGGAAGAAALGLNALGLGVFNLLGSAMPSMASPVAAGLSDPAIQPMFTTLTANALAPAIRYPLAGDCQTVSVAQTTQQTGLVDARGNALSTKVYGYGPSAGQVSWPGWTFQVRSQYPVNVQFRNQLPLGTPLLQPDTTFHWAFSLDGYTKYTVQKNGVPIVPHLHGGHVNAGSDGYTEAFFTPDWSVRGPAWTQKTYTYENDQPAGMLWYHDHALGITRLNVHAGLAGFYVVRDQWDTGAADNPLGLPAYPYEIALAIQDRMFAADGSLYFPGSYKSMTMSDDDSNDVMPEFYGDHITVNGKIWPKLNVEPRLYRLRLLNGCDSRFLALRFIPVAAGSTKIPADPQPLPFTLIGADQGLASSPSTTTGLLFEPGARYDLLVDFSKVPSGSRIIVENLGGDEPYQGALPGDWDYTRTNRIMAFDVVTPRSSVAQRSIPTFAGKGLGPSVPAKVDRIRKVGLFEGTDSMGRVFPLQGIVEPATDYKGRPIAWPSTSSYKKLGLSGPMTGSIGWSDPVTENPRLGDTEEWWIYNTTDDAHPVHLHLVHFVVVGRHRLIWDSATSEDDERLLSSAAKARGDGLALLKQDLPGHMGTDHGRRAIGADKAMGPAVGAPLGAFEGGRRDMVIALPGQITRIRARFDRPGRYVWHCHILSHEDHDMMRPLHVGPI